MKKSQLLILKTQFKSLKGHIFSAVSVLSMSYKIIFFIKKFSRKVIIFFINTTLKNELKSDISKDIKD